jgi:N-carbamoylputrescine amidase
MIGHAVANSVGVVAANRIGTEGEGKTAITFYGSSFVADERGDLVASLGRTEPGIAVATLDVDRIRKHRASMGFFRDRRPDLYSAITR